FLRHTHFDGEPQLVSFSCSKRVVMRPMSSCKLIREGFRSRLVYSRRQKLYSTSFNLRESLLSHIGENQREVEDICDGLRIAGFDDARSRNPAICGSIGPSTENSPSTISLAASAISVPPDMA